MNFYKLISLIAIVVLILCLAVVGVALQYTSSKVSFPPHISECPDYYVKDSDTGVCNVPSNLLPSTANVDCKAKNFSDASYNVPGTGRHSGICQKKLWAQTCDVNWDGVTNVSSVCYATND